MCLHQPHQIAPQVPLNFNSQLSVGHAGQLSDGGRFVGRLDTLGNVQDSSGVVVGGWHPVWGIDSVAESKLLRGSDQEEPNTWRGRVSRDWDSSSIIPSQPMIEIISPSLPEFQRFEQPTDSETCSEIEPDLFGPCPRR